MTISIEKHRGPRETKKAHKSSRSNRSDSPVSGRRERKRTETRERIFRAAMQLFGSRGFFNTTVEDITEAADVGKGTFFNYFPNKEQVFGVLYDIQLAKVGAARKSAESGALSLHDLLRNFVHAIAEEPGKNPLIASGLVVTVISNEKVREMHLETMERGRQIMGEVLKLGQHRGQIRRDITPHELVLALQELLIGTILLWSVHPSSNLKKRLDAAFEIYWSGINFPARKGGELS